MFVLLFGGMLMRGYKLFVEKMEKLTVEERNRIIKKIFGFEEVILYSLDKEDGDIVFRVYNGKKYNKIRIIFTVTEVKNFSEIKLTDISIECDVFLQNFVDDGSNFSKFVKILLEGDISYFDSFL